MRSRPSYIVTSNPYLKQLYTTPPKKNYLNPSCYITGDPDFEGWGGSGGSVNSYSRLTHLLKVNLKKGTLVKSTIDVVLQQAIAFCQEGKLRDAELLYQGILQPQRR